MIYLFNSAFRPEYRTNILNTLYLPSGCVNEYRYSETRHMDPIFRKRNQIKRGEQVTVIYIDRHGSSGFFFHPIRRGTLESFHFQNKQIYLRVLLQDYIYPTEPTQFQDTFKNTIGESKIPRIKDGNPDETADGFFALKSQDTLNTHNALTGEDAWVNSVDAIAQTNVFAEPPYSKVVFLKVDIIKEGKNKCLKPSIRNQDAVFKLKRNNDYKLNFTYRFPYQDSERDATSNMEVGFGDELIAKDAVQIPIESRNNRKHISIKVKKFVENLSGSINLSFPEDSFGPISGINYVIKESRLFWPVILFLLLAFTLCSVTIGLDFSQITLPQSQGIVKTFANLIISISKINWFWLKVIAGFVQALVLFILFRMIGKKFL